MEDNVMILNNDGSWMNLTTEQILEDIEILFNTEITLEEN